MALTRQMRCSGFRFLAIAQGRRRDDPPSSLFAPEVCDDNR